MIKQNFFLTTRTDQNNMYKFIIGMCYKDANHTRKKKLEIKQLKLLKKPSINFLLFIFFCFLKGNFFSKEKILNIRYKKIRIGKYVLSSLYQNYSSYISNFSFIYNLIKTIFKASLYIKTAEYYCKNITFNHVYLDHVYYLNGIYFDFFAGKKKVVYTNDYPGSIFRINFQSKKNQQKLYYENFMKIKFSLNILKKSERLKISKIRNKVLGHKKYFDWIKNIKMIEFKKISNINKYDYIIYTHSFTDAQLIFGQSAFVNTLDWLLFTIQKLLNNRKKIIIKCHPSFWDKFEHNVYDRFIFKKCLSKYFNNPNILILDKAYSNKSLINHLNDKCIAITHHGTVSLEMIQNKFKVISSNCNIWEQSYQLTNCWSSKEDYSNLLDYNWDDLKFHNDKHFQNLIFNLFYGDKSHFSKNEHTRVIVKYLKKYRIKSNQGNNFDLKSNLSKKIYNKIISNYKSCIDYK